MKTEVIRAYQCWPKGHVFADMPPNVAASLIRRGLVREVKDERPLIARVFDKAPADRMMRRQVAKNV